MTVMCLAEAAATHWTCFPRKGICQLRRCTGSVLCRRVRNGSTLSRSEENAHSLPWSDSSTGHGTDQAIDKFANFVDYQLVCQSVLGREA